MTDRAAPGAPLPGITFALTDGTRLVPEDLAGSWAMIVVYRGRHCPRCKPYVAKLESLRRRFEDRGVRLLLASADPPATARRTIAEEGWTLPVACGLSVADMRALGLYITDPGAGSDIHGPYAEPGLFVLNPEGRVQILSTSNAASCRPDLDVLLDGIAGTQDRGLPIRGLC